MRWSFLTHTFIFQFGPRQFQSALFSSAGTKRPSFLLTVAAIGPPSTGTHLVDIIFETITGIQFGFVNGGQCSPSLGFPSLFKAVICCRPLCGTFVVQTPESHVSLTQGPLILLAESFLSQEKLTALCPQPNLWPPSQRQPLPTLSWSSDGAEWAQSGERRSMWPEKHGGKRRKTSLHTGTRAKSKTDMYRIRFYRFSGSNVSVKIGAVIFIAGFIHLIFNLAAQPSTFFFILE